MTKKQTKQPKNTTKNAENKKEEFPDNVDVKTQQLESAGYEYSAEKSNGDDNYNEIDENQQYLSVEERFALNYQDEYDEFYANKILEEEAVREIISKKLSMKELVERERKRQLEKSFSADAIGSQILVMNKSFSKMEPLTVLDDSKAEIVSAGKVKEIAIMHEPTVVYMNMRKYWVGGGIVWKIKYFFVWLVMKATGMMSIGTLKFNLYFIRSDGEYTIDPTIDLTPWELQRKLEAFLQLRGKMLKADIKEKFISGSSEQQNLMNAMKWFIILIGVITVAFLFVMNGGTGAGV